jgi:hypothetical protein
MMNPYGVQHLYDLGLEELERRYARQAGRAHEVGVARRRNEAAIAEAGLPVAEAAGGVPLPALVRQLGLRLVRPQLRKTAA